LDDFLETEMTIITDHWLDKNALKDTMDVKKEVLMICGTNNFSKGANQVIIGNNKSGKSIGLIYYLLARGYLKAQGKSTENLPEMEWWIDDSE
jgi:ribosomal protein S2